MYYSKKALLEIHEQCEKTQEAIQANYDCISAKTIEEIQLLSSLLTDFTTRYHEMHHEKPPCPDKA